MLIILAFIMYNVWWIKHGKTKLAATVKYYANDNGSSGELKNHFNFILFQYLFYLILNVHMA